tara:strand:- start:293 stop:478 length:186 start_codon:yes stop_codon:yes gene_type:complete
LDQDILEVKEQIDELNELLMQGDKWDVVDSRYADRAEVYDEKLSKQELLEELFERRDSNNG